MDTFERHRERNDKREKKTRPPGQFNAQTKTKPKTKEEIKNKMLFNKTVLLSPNEGMRRSLFCVCEHKVNIIAK